MDIFRTKIEQEIAKGSHISIIRLVEGIIEYGYREGASDIHFDPFERSVQVRFRIDGILKDIYSLPKTICTEIISRLKIMSGLRIDEHQIPQDGRFRSQLKEDELVDVRISILPTYYGENAVLRMLNQNKSNVDLLSLGLREKDYCILRNAAKKTSGMILVTGPTGSGKTTTLYSLVETQNSRDVSIVTIEDPVEYAVNGIKQVQINARTGVTFSSGLRAILRQDPNIILVGEIRDTETAAISVNSALTGHLVFTTLHTNDAPSAVTRLFDMKIEPYLLASVLNIVVAQRLVRKICSQCAVVKVITESERKSAVDFLQDSQTMKIGAGCGECAYTGYKGRVGIYEILVMNDELRTAILQKASAQVIREIAVRSGMKTLKEDGLEKVRSGLTTFYEIMRVLYE